MRILVVADLHYTLKQWDWVTRACEGFDVVIIAGDLLDIVSTVDLDIQILVVMKYLKRICPKTRLIVSSGNHDLNGANEAGEKIARWLEQARELDVLVDGDSFHEDGCLFTICPWWEGPRTREAVGDLLERDSARSKDRWIWVYHAPPDGSPVSWTGKKHFGDAALVDWIRQYGPELVLSGHVHHSPFAEGGSWVDRIGDTWVFNTGRQIGPCPTHIILDTEERTAKWFSLAGNESARLDLEEPVVRSEQ